MLGILGNVSYLCRRITVKYKIMETTRITTTPTPRKRLSRTIEWARTHKWMIEVVDPELQKQCKSYKDGKKIIRHETDA